MNCFRCSPTSDQASSKLEQSSSTDNTDNSENSLITDESSLATAMNEMTLTGCGELVGHNDVKCSNSNRYCDDNSLNPVNVSKRIQNVGDIDANINLTDENDLTDTVSTRRDDTKFSTIDTDVAPKTICRCESNDIIESHTESDNISTVNKMLAEKDDYTEQSRVDVDEREVTPDNLYASAGQCSNEDGQDFTENTSKKDSCNQSSTTKKVSNKKFFDLEVHPLYCKWCFWYDCPSRGNVKPVKQDSMSYQDSLNIINVITTVIGYAINDCIMIFTDSFCWNLFSYCAYVYKCN